jgi:hypothetical protein
MLLMSRESCRCRYHLRPVLPHPATHRHSQGHALPFLRKRDYSPHKHKGRTRRNLLFTAVRFNPTQIHGPEVTFWETRANPPRMTGKQECLEGPCSHLGPQVMTTKRLGTAAASSKKVKFRWRWALRFRPNETHNKDGRRSSLDPRASY